MCTYTFACMLIDGKDYRLLFLRISAAQNPVVTTMCPHTELSVILPLLSPP